MADDVTGQDAQQNPPETKTFDEAYVKQLRQEAADHRIKAKDLAERLVKLETSQKDAETAKLTEQQQYKELADKLTKELDDAKKQLDAEKMTRRQLSIQASLQAEAVKLGIIDVEAAMKLADLSSVELTDSGDVRGVKEALEALIKAKPYLKGQATPPPIDPTNPSGSGKSGLTVADLTYKRGRSRGKGGVVYSGQE